MLDDGATDTVEGSGCLQKLPTNPVPDTKEYAKKRAIQDCGLKMQSLEGMVRQCELALPTGYKTDFWSFGESVALRHGHLTLSTLCSGTDGCVDALKAGAPIISVVAGATVRFVGPTPHFFCQDVICYAADLYRNEDRENFFQRAVLHQLCSDLDPRCQQYLLGTQRPQLFVPDMKMALNDLVENAIDGQVAFVPRSSCLVCCWVCHDASGPYVFESRCL